MHDAGNFALVFGAQRHDVASVALRDQLLLQVFGVVRVGEQALQAALEALGGGAHIAAQDRQLGRGSVVDVASVVQHAADLALQRGAFFKALGDAR